MKRSVSISITMVSLLAVVAYSGAVYSQQDNKADQGKQDNSAKSEAKDQKLTGTYLDVAHAKDNAVKYEDIIKDDIYKLQVVVGNFGDASDKSALETIQKDHLTGRKELFKRNYLNAYNILKKTRGQIHSLFQGLSDRYQKKANEILGRCADTIVDKEIGMGNTGDINVTTAAKTSRKITQNKIKLTIAYDQLNMGDKFKFDERLSDAVTHYRIAKLHGIGILVDMADSENDKSKIKNEYKADQMDGDNLVSK
jgi:hypothetical protein